VLIQYLGHVGLALATSISAFLNAYLLWRGLVRTGVYRFAKHWQSFLARIGCGLTIMGVGLWTLAPAPEAWLSMTVAARACWMAGLCLGGSMTYFLILMMTGLKLQEFRDG